jgi:hypothetical protein
MAMRQLFDSVRADFAARAERPPGNHEPAIEPVAVVDCSDSAHTSGHYGRYPEAMRLDAVDAASRLGTTAAAAAYHVRPRTLAGWRRESDDAEPARVGRPTVLSDQQEQSLTDWILLLRYDYVAVSPAMVRSRALDLYDGAERYGCARRPHCTRSLPHTAAA